MVVDGEDEQQPVSCVVTASVITSNNISPSNPSSLHQMQQLQHHQHAFLVAQAKLEEEQRQQQTLLLLQQQKEKERLIQLHLEKERLLQVQQDRLESLKKKEKHQQSAIASSEVKQRLQEFVLLKKQREAAAKQLQGMGSGYSSGASSGGSSHNGSGGPGSPSSTSLVHPHGILMHPSSMHQQHLLQHIHGHHSGHQLIQHSHPAHPVHQSSLSSNSSSGSRMEPLYSSPSMPNISLGRTSNSPSRAGVSYSLNT